MYQYTAYNDFTVYTLYNEIWIILSIEQSSSACLVFWIWIRKSYPICCPLRKEYFWDIWKFASLFICPPFTGIHAYSVKLLRDVFWSHWNTCMGPSAISEFQMLESICWSWFNLSKVSTWMHYVILLPTSLH